MYAAPKGFSLLELLIACGLLALLGMGFLLLLTPTLSALGRGVAQTETQQQAALALDRIERELRTATTTSIGVMSQTVVGPGQNPGLYLTPLQDVNDQGQPVWRPQLLAFWWNPANRRLLMKSWPPLTPPSFAQPPTSSHPAQLTGVDFRDLISSTNGSERSLASGVVFFDALHAGTGPALVPPLTLKIELERQEGHHLERFSFRKVFCLRTL